ncbi:putative TATA-box binding protein [Chlorella virus XW01]|nr:putative TATA-box binding protein [Chlorella virus XW01]
MMWDKYQFKDYLNVNNFEINNLPDGLNISTMTSSLRDTKLNFNFEKIYNELPLSINDIVCVKRNKEDIKTINNDMKKERKKKITTSKKLFFNQMTVVVRVFENELEKPSMINKERKINFKLFINGSIQMSGVKKIEYANRALNKLFYHLNKINSIENFENLNTKSFFIDMILVNYRIRVQINRANLYNLLIKKKIKSSYEKAIRACVNIKYKPTDADKEISIFVFQKGNILIAGAKNKESLINTYNFINDIIINHIDEIINIDDNEKEKDIMKFYYEVLEENKHKHIF